ncbi:MAG: 3-dehydroquinate synthase II [Candidatus Odinarchaeia archaeon]
MTKEIWLQFDKGNWNTIKEKIISSLEHGLTKLILKTEDVAKAKKLGQFEIGLYFNEQIEQHQPDLIILNQDQETSLSGKKAKYFEIKSNQDVQTILKLKEKYDYFIISTKDWKVIPLENLIAEFQKTDSKLIAVVENVQDAKTFLETLEHGTDGILYINPELKQIKELSDLLKASSALKLKLTPGKIVGVKPLGVGDRVCIDTCSILKKGEGMLIGSQSSGLFLVHSETLESEYVSSRPFRVNAGPVHSYISVPGNKTKYLSELKAGDEVLIVNYKGETYTAIVGRVKIEVRPLMLVEVKVNEKIYKIILQNAETIRLVYPNGEPVSITELKAGDEVLLHISESGRHFGTEIEETIIER